MLTHPRVVAALVAVAAIWGLTFPLVQDAVAEMPTMRFLAVRFAIAAVCLSFAFRRADRRTVVAGVTLGAIWALAYVAQTLGLRTSTATNVAFITGLYVALTPVLAATISRRLPGGRSLAGVAAATAGLVLLAAPTGIALQRGDALALLCAALFAAHIVGIGIVARGVDPLALTAVQAVTASVLSLAVSLPVETAAWSVPSRGTLGTLLLTGAGASALALVVQTRAQRVLPATPVAVILTMESVFGGVFAYLLAGDRLTAAGWAGAALITGGMVVAALEPTR